MRESPRVRRLKTEHREMSELMSSSSLVCFECSGSPPTSYTVQLSCKGLAIWNNKIVISDSHAFEILLGDDFPYNAPKIAWMTPVLHPNIKPPDVCLGDHWYPGSSIARICEAIIEMVQFKSFNVYDPLNKEAAQWLVIQLESETVGFPVDPRPIRDLDFEVVPQNPTT